MRASRRLAIALALFALIETSCSSDGTLVAQATGVDAIGAHDIHEEQDPAWNQAQLFDQDANDTHGSLLGREYSSFTLQDWVSFSHAVVIHRIAESTDGEPSPLKRGIQVIEIILVSEVDQVLWQDNTIDIPDRITILTGGKVLRDGVITPVDPNGLQPGEVFYLSPIVYRESLDRWQALVTLPLDGDSFEGAIAGFDSDRISDVAEAIAATERHPDADYDIALPLARYTQFLRDQAVPRNPDPGPTPDPRFSQPPERLEDIDLSEFPPELLELIDNPDIDLDEVDLGVGLTPEVRSLIEALREAQAGQ